MVLGCLSCFICVCFNGIRLFEWFLHGFLVVVALPRRAKSPRGRSATRPRLHSLTGGEGQGGEGNEKCQISPNSVKNVCVYVYIYVMYIYIYSNLCVYNIYNIRSMHIQYYDVYTHFS